MLAYFKRLQADATTRLMLIAGMENDDTLVCDNLNRLIAGYMNDHGLKPTPFGRIHRAMFGVAEKDRLALNRYISGRVHHMMLHDPMLSAAAGRMARLLGTCHRAAYARPGGYAVDDIAMLDIGTLVCNRCHSPLTFDHCTLCGLIDHDIVQFSNGRHA